MATDYLVVISGTFLLAYPANAVFLSVVGLHSIIQFDPTSTLEATPPGPVHFSFKSANPGIPAITEQNVRDAMRRICGHLVDVVIRQQTNAQDNGCICGYGFLTCLTLVDTINAVKYTYQRLIDDVVFDCQFSDVFQKGPHFTPELKRLKHERKNFHSAAAALPFSPTESGSADALSVRSRGLDSVLFSREHIPALQTDSRLHQQQFNARPGLPLTSYEQSPHYPPALRTPRDYPSSEHIPSSERHYGQPLHAHYYRQRSPPHLPQDAYLRERRHIENQEHYRPPVHHHPVEASSAGHFLEASMYGGRDVPRFTDHDLQMFDDHALYHQRRPLSMHGLGWSAENGSDWSASKEDWSDAAGRWPPNHGFPQVPQGDLSVFHRSESGSSNRTHDDDFHLTSSTRGLPSRSSSSLFSSTQPFAFP